MATHGVVHLRIEPAAPVRLCRDAAEAAACGLGASDAASMAVSEAKPAAEQHGPRTVSLSLQRAVWVENGLVRHEEGYCCADTEAWTATGEGPLRFPLTEDVAAHAPGPSLARHCAQQSSVDIALLTLKSAHDLAPWLVILARRADAGFPGVRELSTGDDAVGLHMLSRVAAVAGPTLESLETVVEAPVLDVFSRFDWSLFPRLRRIDVSIVCPHLERTSTHNARELIEAPPAYWEAIAFPELQHTSTSQSSSSLPRLDTISLGVEICSECHVCTSLTTPDPLGALPAETHVNIPAETISQLGEQLHRFGLQCVVSPSFFFQEGARVGAPERQEAQKYQKLLEDDIARRRAAAKSRLNLSLPTSALAGGHTAWAAPLSPTITSH